MRKNFRTMALSASLMLTSALSLAQQRTVSGTVRDERGNPLPGVAVVVRGTTVGVVTDVDGRYSITVDGTPILQASFLGMTPADINTAQGQTDATLREERAEVDEVIVVAYGTTTKGAYTGSAAVVGAATLEKRQVSNVSSALAGVMPGVQTLSANGQPGTGSTVLVRGVGSLNASTAPLYVVDGMPFDGDLSTLSTGDIENITVLKDAASTSLYGARGANGIVMVTTKRGRKGEARITVEGRWGANSREVENYDVLRDPAEYYETAYAAFRNYYLYRRELSADEAHSRANAILVNTSNSSQTPTATGYGIWTLPDGEELIGADGRLNPAATLGYSADGRLYTPDNWEDEIFKRQSRSQYDLAISGGTERFDYYFSLGSLFDGGVIPNSNFRRLATRLKVDYQAKEWLNVGANATYTHQRFNYPSLQTSSSSSMNAFFVANFIAPVYPIYVRNADGSISHTNGRVDYDYGDGASTPFRREFMAQANPLGDLQYDKRRFEVDVFQGNLSADVTALPGLTLSARFGFYLDNTQASSLSNAYMGQSVNSEGSADQESIRSYAFDQQYVGNWHRQVADAHDIDLTVGYDGYHRRTTTFGGYGTHLYNPGSWHLSNVTMDQYVWGSQDRYATAGWFGRLSYAYAEKYLASVSYRRDSSSRFHPDRRWGNFWSVSTGWLLNKEGFWGWQRVDMLKLKVSYGQQGNDGVGNDYAYADQYSVSGAAGRYSDVTLSYKGNPALTWETMANWNAGVDFALWGSRLAGTVEWFNRKSDDMLYNKPVAPSNGYTSIPMNIGSISNYGVEIDLRGEPLRLAELKWTLTANAAFTRNRINRLHPELGGRWETGNRVYEEGQSMYRYNIVEWAGVNPTDGAPQFMTTDDQGRRVVTTSYSEAQTHRKATGDCLPKVHGGFGTTVEFFGFDASASFSYQLGGTMFDSGYSDLMHSGNARGYNWHTDIRRAWTPTNTHTDVPRLDYGDTYGYSTSTRFLVSSNYLSLNNVTFGYTVPAKLVERVFLSSVRLYFTAENVALWSKRKGLDPRQGFMSATTSVYTAVRSVSGGIKIAF